MAHVFGWGLCVAVCVCVYVCDNEYDEYMKMKRGWWRMEEGRCV
jgi:hypothetical protein